MRLVLSSTTSTAMAKQANKAPSQRQRRVAEEVRHALAQALDRGEVRDPAVIAQPVTFTAVEMTPDLRVAKVFVTPLGGGDPSALLKGLGRAAPALRQYIGRSIRLRSTPELRFLHDDRFDALDHIENLLRDPKVAQDLSAAEEDGEDETHGPS